MQLSQNSINPLIKNSAHSFTKSSLPSSKTYYYDIRYSGSGNTSFDNILSCLDEKGGQMGARGSTTFSAQGFFKNTTISTLDGRKFYGAAAMPSNYDFSGFGQSENIYCGGDVDEASDFLKESSGAADYLEFDKATKNKKAPFKGFFELDLSSLHPYANLTRIRFDFTVKPRQLLSRRSFSIQLQYDRAPESFGGDSIQCSVNLQLKLKKVHLWR